MLPGIGYAGTINLTPQGNAHKGLGLSTYSDPSVALSVGEQAQKIEGTILIEEKLPKRCVTTCFSICPRGATVQLGKGTAIIAGKG